MDAVGHVDRAGEKARAGLPATWPGGAGCCARQACRRSFRAPLAASHAHDVNGLLGLLQQGCPPATALRITARDERAAVA